MHTLLAHVPGEIAIGVLLFLGRFVTLVRFGTFFDTFDEVAVGRQLLAGVLGAGILGLLIGFIAQSRGKNFLDWWFFGAGISAVVIIVLYFIGALNFLIPIINPNPAPEINQLEVAPVKGGLAPYFELLSLSGETISLSDFRGKGVLINFWATWCAPCRLEMPAIQDRAN